MSLSVKEVQKIAKLSRIKLNEDEVGHFQKELSNIIDWIEQLKEVDTDNVEPMTSVIKMKSPVREDKITDGGYRDDVLANAPKSDYGCFVVPKVIDGE